jgi:RNA polymerase sigma-70 factor (ECF subfamily)
VSSDQNAVNVNDEILRTTKTYIDSPDKYLNPDEPELDKLYLDYYGALSKYAFTMVNNSEIAEEMVQQVFFKILERSKPISIHTSVKAYLYRSVNNECLNYIKHQKVKRGFEAHSTHIMKQSSDTPSGKLQLKELEEQLRKALCELPEQCRTIFQLSRFEELKYAEIASQLGLSIKTVETQMSRALKKLRIQLADYLPLLIWLLINML